MGVFDALNGALGDFISRRAILKMVNAAPPRPRPWSMAHNYTTWLGLFGRTWNGRHLPEATPDELDGLPDEQKVVCLFHQHDKALGESVETPSDRTSVLFMFVAQWFTDSFLRTDPHDQRRTDSNHEIDLCQLYGLTEEKTTMLRQHENGKPTHLMAHQMKDGVEYPLYLYEKKSGKIQPRKQFAGEKDPNGGWEIEPLHPDRKIARVIATIPEDIREERLLQYFAMGLEHGNSTVGYVALNVLFLREHNRIARLLKRKYGDKSGWDDERIFQTTRNIMIVLLIKVVMEDYVSHIAGLPIKMPIGLADKARWGKPNHISIEFNLLYRWHSMIPSKIRADGQDLDPKTYLHNPDFVMKKGLGVLVADFSRQPAGRLGLHNVPSFMFMGNKSHPKNHSTVQRTIATMRAAKLKPMNAYRAHFSLKPYRSFEDLVGDGPGAAKLVGELKDLYGSIHKLEWFVGIFAEKFKGQGIMGELMLQMVANDAFTQALNNPLLSEALFNDETFTREGMEIIADTSQVKDIARRALGVVDPVCSMEVLR